MSKEEITTNKSAMQVMVHFSKIPAFLYLGFNYVPNISFSLLTNVESLLGTRFGIAMLRRMSETLFLKVFKIALLATGLGMVYKLMY